MNALHHSFGAAYALLERPLAARRAVAALLIVHTLLLAYSAYVHSPTLNEPGHLVAGLSHWKFGRFEIYCCNPPLVKMVAALPVIAVGYNEDWSGFYTGPGARPEFSMGEDFVAANGERSFFLFMIARWACIPFSWLGAIVCYLWGRDLYGRPSGVMAAAIWCFEPNILAHASLITADAHATALGLATCYTFWRWLKQPTWPQAALTGIVLGLAELAKTTLIVFYPLWPMMWLAYRFLAPRSSPVAPHWFLREAGMLTVRMLVGLYVLNLGYGFEGSFTQLKDHHFVSNLFTRLVPNPTSNLQHPPSASSDSSLLATRSTLLSLPSPFPRNYLLGIDITQKYFEDPGQKSYLRGEWRDHGWWYYYLYAATIKMPLALWLLGFLVIAVRVLQWRPSRKMEQQSSSGVGQQNGQLTTNDQRLSPSLADEFILLSPAFVIFVVVSSHTTINEHFRFVLPSFPMLFIFLSQSARLFQLPSA